MDKQEKIVCAAVTENEMQKALEIIKDREAISTSYLQRRMRITYARATEIIVHLYEKGIVKGYNFGLKGAVVVKSEVEKYGKS